MNATGNRNPSHDTSTAGLCMKLGIVTALVASTGCAAGQVTDTAGEPVAAPAPRAAVATVSVQGATLSSDGSPLAGVSVCVRPDPMTSDHATCTTSDGSGAWKLAGVPSNALVAVTFIKAGLFPTLRPVATGTGDLTIPAGDGTLVAPGNVDALMSGPVDPTAGHVAFSSAMPGTRPAAEVTAILDSLADPQSTQTRPVYFDGGFFGNLTPGYYALTLSGATVSCSSSGGLYGFPVTTYTPAGQARLMFPVVAGFLTAPVAASCR
jgi:hypothetical protein